MNAHIDRDKVRILMLKAGKRDKVYAIDKAGLKRFAKVINYL